MKIAPQTNFDIVTQLSQEDILQKLDSIIETDTRKYYSIKIIEKMFLGFYTTNYFHAVTSGTFFTQNPNKIEIKGKIKETENNDFIIHVSIDSEVNLKFSLIISIITTIITLFIVYNVKSKEFIYNIFPFIFIPIHFAYSFSQSRKITDAKNMLVALFSKS
ncbi:MAG: hypothetical protein U0U67_10775 [Chitinophagales bacterium]